MIGHELGERRASQAAYAPASMSDFGHNGEQHHRAAMDPSQSRPGTPSSLAWAHAPAASTGHFSPHVSATMTAAAVSSQHCEFGRDAVVEHEHRGPGQALKRRIADGAADPGYDVGARIPHQRSLRRGQSVDRYAVGVVRLCAAARQR